MSENSSVQKRVLIIINFINQLDYFQWLRVGFVVDEVALGQILPPVLQFSPVSIIPPLLHTHLFISHRRCIISAIDSIVKYGF